MNNIELMDAMRACMRYMHILPDGGSGQPRLLGILLENGDMAQRELQESAGVRSATISETLSKLESIGMINRRVSDTDRRTVIVSLTEKGMIAANDIEDSRAERADELFGCFDDAEKETFGTQISKLSVYWREKFGDERFREHHKPHDFGGHTRHHDFDGHTRHHDSNEAKPARDFDARDRHHDSSEAKPPRDSDARDHHHDSSEAKPPRDFDARDRYRDFGDTKPPRDFDAHARHHDSNEAKPPRDFDERDALRRDKHHGGRFMRLDNKDGGDRHHHGHKPQPEEPK